MRHVVVLTGAAAVAAGIWIVLMLLDPNPSDGGVAAEVATPLLLVVEPKDEPPMVELVRTADGLERLQVGIILNGTWRRGGDFVELSEGVEQVTWPAAVPLAGASNVAVRFPTEAMPILMTVNVYGDTLDADGAPVGEPIFSVDCATADMLPGGECELDHVSDSFVLTGVRLARDGISRIAVNVHWSLRDSSDTTVWATWLFTVTGDL